MPTRRLLLAVLATLAATPCLADGHTDGCAYRAGLMFDALGHRDYSTAAFQMDGHLQAQSFPKLLPSMWNALLDNNYGAYLGHGEATVTRNADGTTTLSIPLQFERMTPSYRVTCDPEPSSTVREFVMQ
jgi:hypothetical protein